jgi:hypothetical protein
MSGKPTLCPGCHRCNYARGGARSGGDALIEYKMGTWSDIFVD